MKMLSTRQLLDYKYNTIREFESRDYSKASFLAEYLFTSECLFNLITYDDDLDLLFVNKIMEIIEVIINRNNLEYIQDNNNYINFILVCNLLNQIKLITWGISVRTCWIDYNERKILIEKIIFDEEDIDKPIIFNEKNLKELIDWYKEPIINRYLQLK